jgi:hypothetical protein
MARVKTTFALEVNVDRRVDFRAARRSRGAASTFAVTREGSESRDLERQAPLRKTARP